MKCVNNHEDCQGPMAPQGSNVCYECSLEYDRLVEIGVTEDFVNDDHAERPHLEEERDRS